MKFIKKYIKKKRIKENIFYEFQISINNGDFERSLILSKRFLKFNKW
jgi:hypothetical protein